MSKYNFLQLQHPMLKLAFAFVSLLFAGFVNSYAIIVSLVIVLLLLSTSKNYILNWIRAISRLSPLFISILISGFIFSLPFPNQLELVLRIAFLLSVSLYVFLTIPVDYLTTLVHRRPDGLIHDISKFLWKTSQLVPFFFNSFKTEYRNHKPDFVKAIAVSFAKAHEEEHEHIELPPSKEKIPPVHTWNNILLILLISVEMGYLIWSFI